MDEELAERWGPVLGDHCAEPSWDVLARGTSADVLGEALYEDGLQPCAEGD